MLGVVETDLDPVWRALASPVRRRILDVLKDGSRTTGEIAAAFADLSRFAVMQHLGVLEEARLVIQERAGRLTWNHLNAVPLRQIYERWVSGFADQWAANLVAIKRAAESGPPRKEPGHG